MSDDFNGLSIFDPVYVNGMRAIEEKEQERREAAEQYLWDVQYQLEDLEMEIADHDEYLAVARKLIDEAESSEYSDLLDFDLLYSYLV